MNNRVVKEKLADLEMVYSINLLKLDGRDYCIAASECRDGRLFLIDCLTKAKKEVKGLDGGIMSMIPIPGGNGSFFAIQRFYPVFQSREAQVVKVQLRPDSGDVVQADVGLVADVPYVHRITLFQEAGELKIIAGTLCTIKGFEQDWSSPGEVVVLSPDNNEPPVRVLQGIHKHHGMFTLHDGERPSFWVSGEEGVFKLWSEAGMWMIKKQLSDCVSDIALFDLDGDGINEMVAISPFHGDKLRVFHESEHGWVSVAEQSLTFGHVVWAGKIDNLPCIIACSRGGDKAATLYVVRNGDDGVLSLDGTRIDAGVGTANICVSQDGGKTVIYAANHGVNEVVRYTVTL